MVQDLDFHTHPHTHPSVAFSCCQLLQKRRGDGSVMCWGDPAAVDNRAATGHEAAVKGSDCSVLLTFIYKFVQPYIYIYNILYLYFNILYNNMQV